MELRPVNLAELDRFWRDQLAALGPAGSGGAGTAALRADIHTDLGRLGHALGSPAEEVRDHLRAAAAEHHRIFGDPAADASLKTGARAELAMALSILAGSASQRTDIARFVRRAGAGADDRGRVAEALAALALDEPPPAPPPPGAGAGVKAVHELAACDAVAARAAAGFLAALAAALRSEDPDDEAPSTDRLLALTELALCRLAIERGIVSPDTLPADAALPLPLVATSSESA